ncbi:hypothetical protein BABINDRAFT_161234 [Babjeviella inositovora NRRL Y-12698]|uniref:Uncharacterized protein n=1 Tax=Babjeviella inositovora NRRL Y-12698 TaxID=984486 RepID=A0A1E3QRE8_9ASCO|nr:uncharacterized protein BABINDRAFT_161234 [Babjeviella inositovora NRRL Y-12698]ODQ80269.1 hypothetical protein BABINDRAFT_161234 [Babjeviella inositovora NRRL Y-12698]
MDEQFVDDENTLSFHPYHSANGGRTEADKTPTRALRFPLVYVHLSAMYGLRVTHCLTVVFF